MKKERENKAVFEEGFLWVLRPSVSALRAPVN